MRRVLVTGTATWTDRAVTTAAIRRVVEVYKGPYTLVTDTTTGAGRYAAAVARDHGWTVDSYTVETKCAADCPSDHRRAGGPDGDYCPTAPRRAFEAQLDLKPDVVIFLYRQTDSRGNGERMGQKPVKDRGLALWQFSQKRSN